MSAPAATDPAPPNKQAENRTLRRHDLVPREPRTHPPRGTHASAIVPGSGRAARRARARRPLVRCAARGPAPSGDATASAWRGSASSSGAVAVQRGDSATPVDAVLNAPVLGGDYVTTGDAARAEIQFDGSSAVRLGPGVQLRFTHLDAGNRQLQLAEGTVDLRVLRGPRRRRGIDTPSVALRPRGAGSYRVTRRRATAAAQVTVRSGAADIVTPQGTRALLPGTTLGGLGRRGRAHPHSGAALAYDDFDRFNGERDAREQRALANAYVDERRRGRRRSERVRPLGQRRLVRQRLGAQPRRRRTGRRTATAAGSGKTTTAGPGSPTSPGAGRPITTGTGTTARPTAGAGTRAPPATPSAFWRPALVAFISFGNGGWGCGRHRLGAARAVRAVPPLVGLAGYTNVTTVTNVTNVTNILLRQRRQRRGRDRALPQPRHRRRDRGRREALHRGPVRPPASRSAPAQLERVALVRGPVPVVPTEANLRFTPATAPPRRSPRCAARWSSATFAGRATPVARTPFEQQRSAIAQLRASLRRR